MRAVSISDSAALPVSSFALSAESPGDHCLEAQSTCQQLPVREI
jgi:hypothetical protein